MIQKSGNRFSAPDHAFFWPMIGKSGKHFPLPTSKGHDHPAQAYCAAGLAIDAADKIMDTSAQHHLLRRREH